MKTQINIIATDPVTCREIASNPNWTTAQLYPGFADGHKYNPGDLCVLHGLQSYPEHNGETVKISAIREDGVHGKAYYVEGAINEAINWVYEYRLKPLQAETITKTHTEDYIRYCELKRIMSELIHLGRHRWQQFSDAWEELESLKNKYGGVPPMPEDDEALSQELCETANEMGLR